MTKDTDYKRLWREREKQCVALSNQVMELKGQLEAQMDILKKVRDGLLKPNELFKEEQEKIEFLRQQKKEVEEEKRNG